MKSNKKQKLLKSWAEKNHINAFLFDLDDTLIDTHLLFYTHVEETLDYIHSRHQEIDRELLGKRLREINDESFRKHSVNPVRWNHVLIKLSKEFTQISDKTVKDANRIIRKIYKSPPRIHDGVIDTLDLIKGLGIDLVLVTHANEKWTKYKLRSTGLSKYFSYIHIADENKHKTPKVWKEALKKSNLKPKEVVVVGDNLKGDIMSAYSIGVEHLFWVDRADGWRLYKEGGLPKVAITIKHVNEIVKIIDPNRKE